MKNIDLLEKVGPAVHEMLYEDGFDLSSSVENATYDKILGYLALQLGDRNNDCIEFEGEVYELAWFMRAVFTKEELDNAVENFIDLMLEDYTDHIRTRIAKGVLQ